MSAATREAKQAVKKAREALRRNDRGQARQWAERAAHLAPGMEDPWLVLATLASPRASIQFIQRALRANPNSPRARRGMQWAMQRLSQSGADEVDEATQQTPAVGQGATVRSAPRPTPAAAPRPARRRRLVFPVLLLLLGCMVCAFAGWTATTSPVVASILPQVALSPGPTQPSSWAVVPIAKPTYTPASPLANVVGELATPTAEPSEAAPTASSGLSTAESTGSPTELSTGQSTDQLSDLPAATEPAPSDIPTAEPTWSGSFSMQIVADTPTPENPPLAPPTTDVSSPVTASGEHWIDVNLTQQKVYAYAGDALVNSFVVSTGVWSTPTVTGQYHIYVKLRYTDMSGPDYYLPDVPYTMYFYKGYGLHGTYWHHNFGTPMSHGCVNLSIPDAQWLYEFSSVGTLVNVHY
jgi:lipoprotein-anchoring transpeptidase ErfK/SrfK